MRLECKQGYRAVHITMADPFNRREEDLSKEKIVAGIIPNRQEEDLVRKECS